MGILESINSSNDLKKLSLKELNILSSEIRSFLIDNVSKTGGHLASNLGVVELTLALNIVFDAENDKIVWDVGHQCYTHKIINGRRNKFDTLRKKDGLSGFPKTSESKTDAFDTGHSSTSVSAALGFSAANKLSGTKSHSVAVIGDGALTGGMAFEALNNAAGTKLPLIVILNDNGMAISENVGGLSKYLKKIRNRSGYFKAKTSIKKNFIQSSSFGRKVGTFLSSSRDFIKKHTLDKELFENLGLRYYGPINGHDIKSLITALEYVKDIESPLILHVKTVKGKGYSHAEMSPYKFHGIGKFDPETGDVLSTSQSDLYSDIFGESMTKLAKNNEKLVCITAAMAEGTGLLKYSSLYPDRFFDCGIAEEHCVTFASALAAEGYTPVFAVYSTFLQRAYDQILHDVALTKKHVVFAIDRAGIVGPDGETHQGIYDLSYLSHIPNMTIMAPSGKTEFEKMLSFSVNSLNSPVAVRYPKGAAVYYTDTVSEIELGKANVIKEGSDVLIVSIGSVLKEALDTAKILEEDGISVAIIDARFLKPFDTETVRKYSSCKVIVSIEDNVLLGGLSEAVIKTVNREILSFGIPDTPVLQGEISEIREHFGITKENISREIKSKLMKG